MFPSGQSAAAGAASGRDDAGGSASRKDLPAHGSSMLRRTYSATSLGRAAEPSSASDARLIDAIND
jgi:hypothetical protein